MIDFSCREPDIEDIMRCSFALSGTEYRILSILVSSKGKVHSVAEIAKTLSLERTGAQKALKVLHEKGLCQRKKCNLPEGGYSFCYYSRDSRGIRQKAKKSVSGWLKRAYSKIDSWK